MKKSAAVMKTNALRLAECAGLAFEAFEYDISDGRIDANSIAEKLGRSPDEVFKTLVAKGEKINCRLIFDGPRRGESYCIRDREMIK